VDRTSIKIKHNMEMAHRLYQTPGKCQSIHGHSWWVTLELHGQTDSKGLLQGLDFGTAKMVLREYMDRCYDHHLLLNDQDPFAKPLWTDAIPRVGGKDVSVELPGLVKFYGDPTTELIAAKIGRDMLSSFSKTCGIDELAVDVWETATNNARWESR